MKKCSVHSLRKCSQNPKNRKPLTLIHMGNARVHTAGATEEKLDVSRFKRTQQPPYMPDIASSDLFFSVG
jgi:transposase